MAQLQDLALFERVITFLERSDYRNGSVSRGPKTLLQTWITNPPGGGLQRWWHSSKDWVKGWVRVSVLQAVLLTWGNGNLCTVHIYFVTCADFQEYICFP